MGKRREEKDKYQVDNNPFHNKPGSVFCKLNRSVFLYVDVRVLVVTIPPGDLVHVAKCVYQEYVGIGGQEEKVEGNTTEGGDKLPVEPGANQEAPEGACEEAEE